MQIARLQPTVVFYSSFGFTMTESSGRTPSSDSCAAAQRPSPGRRSLRSLLQSVMPQRTAPASAQRGRLLLESLESRQLLAGDVELLFTDNSDQPTSSPAEASTLTTSTTGEGEAAPDLVAFANALDAAGVVFYGANWCPACTEQKQLFQDGGDDLPFVEVTDGDRNLNQVGIDEGITTFPTWEFPDSSRETGVLSLATISTRSGVAIPQSEQPTFEPIGSQTVGFGSPLHIPVDAYDPDGGPLTVTVSVQDPGLLEATVVSGNRSLRLDMNGFGDMVFELFETRAPEAAGRVITLAEDGFYDGIIFHRVVDNFVIQAGDPTGTGTSGSTLGQFDDDFHPDLQHNTSGILSFAKTDDDTNNSQFFVTEVPTRHLDFNHSIFGQLVEGEDVREAISGMSTNSGGTPDTPITINNASIFTDSENSVLMFRALASTGTTNVTVTVTDQDGNTHSEVVAVTLAADTSNSQPFLGDVATPAPVVTGSNSTLQLTSIDVEGDAVSYLQSIQTTGSGASASVNSTTGLVTVTPASGFVGTVDVLVGVQAASGGSDFDSQIVSFEFVAQSLTAPTSIDLIAASDSGSSDSDNITNVNTTSFTVAGVTSGNTVEIVETTSGSVVGTGVATGTSVTITTSNVTALGDGTYTLAARQRDGSSVSEISPIMTITIDKTVPDSVVATAGLLANVNTAYTTNLVSVEEGNGLIYGLSNPPTGMTVDPTTGVISWTPISTQTGTNAVTLTLTDVAGNVRTEAFSVEVGEEPLVSISLVVTDLNGSPITDIGIGEEFLLQMIAVDERSTFDLSGVFSAYADVLFDSSLVRPVPGSTIDYPSTQGLLQRGTLGDGIIDELGSVSSGTVATGLEETLIATVRLEALAAGAVNFTSNAADVTGNEVLLFLEDDEITPNQIAFGSVSLGVTEGFTVVDDTATVAEDSSATVIDVLANDTTVASSTTLSVTSVTQPTTGGTVQIISGAVLFTPAADFFGDAVFTYQVTGSTGGTQTGSVAVTVTGVNDAPTAVADTFTVDQDTTGNTLGVLANDTSAPDGTETLTVTAVGTTSQGGTVSITGNGGAVSYSPAADFVGTETFTYTVSDGTLTSTETVTVTVSTTNNPPTAVADSFTVTEDAAEAAFDVMSNDTRDSDNEAFVLNGVGTPSQGGTARISSDGTQFFYQPAVNFAGTETVSYTIRDTGGGLATGLATFIVGGVNDAPPSTDISTSVVRSSGQQTVVTLSDLPANVDSGETLVFQSVTTATQGGAVSIAANAGSILYTPPTGTFTGDDTFTYTVSDGNGLTSTGTVTVTVHEYSERVVTLQFDNSPLRQLSASSIRLTGTNLLGEAVDVPLVTDVFENWSAAVLPGDYTINIPAIPFLQNASVPQQIQVTSAADDGDVSVDASVGRLRPEFMDIRDWLGSARKSNILTAVSPGESHLLSTPSSVANAVTDAVVTLNTAGTEVTITGKDSSDADVQAVIAVDNDNRVQTRGQSGTLRLFKISIDPEDVSFTAVTAASVSTASSGDPVSVSASSSSQLVGSSNGEGEVALAAASSADVFVPAASAATSTAILQTEDDHNQAGSDGQATASDGVDAAMPDVAQSLSIESQTAEEVASRQALGETLDASAIDSLLADGSL